MAKRKKDRRYGEGSVYPYKKGYAGQISINFERTTVYGKTEDEVREKLDKLLLMSAQGLKLNPKMSFESWLDFWFERYHRPNCKERTWKDNKALMDNRIKPKLGKINLSSLALIRFRFS
ncbi:MAG: hypothetical protein ABFC94_13560 [Syntrophomonas sp.]